MIYQTVLCLGDSLTAGARAEHDGHAGLGYPEWLVHLLDQITGDTTSDPPEWAVLNRGISGQTTRQIADRASGAVRELAGYAGAKWAVLLAGTNDSKVRGCDLREWEALYRQTCHWARRAGIPLALCTLPPVDPAAMPAFTAESLSWMGDANARIAAMAAEFDGRPSPVRLVDLSDLPTSLLVDGVHFTAAGNVEVACRVAAAITGADLERVRSLAPRPLGAFERRLRGEPVGAPPPPKRRRRRVPGVDGVPE